MGPLLRWAKKHSVLVIEDAAHALGATLDGDPVGTLADGAIFSLGRGKHLNTMGGGLAVVSDDEAGARLKALSSDLPTDSALALARSVVMEGIVATGTKPLIFQTLAAPPLRLARRWGFDPMAALFEDDKGRLAGIPDQWQRRLSNLQAHFGLEALDAFDRALARRREIAGRLVQGLDGVLPIQRPAPGADPAWLELTVRVGDRDAFQRALLERGVDTQRTWMDACDMLEAFRSSPGGPCPVARELGMHALYLPTYASLSDRQCDHIVRSVRDVAGEGGP
jgi:dTDP-4-amino-4,6-dideoxygalactose transaminase